jgi:signal transduction histidine kinase
MLAEALTSLDKAPKLTLTILLLAFTTIVGFFNYISGIDTTFSAVYLLPIAIAAWHLSRTVALGFCILSTFYWVAGDTLAGAHYATLWIPVWNTGVRFAVFVVGAYVVAEFKELHQDLENRASERAAKLTEEIATREKLERELLDIIEREHRRLGQDIHDSLCQHLTGTAFAAQVLVQNLKSQGSPQAHNAVRVVGLIEDGIMLSRSLAKGLSSVRLSTDGLMDALEDFASTTSDLFKVSCRFECPLPVLIDDPETAEHLYRIAQEAVGNAIKHGRAKIIRIQLEVSEAGTLLRVVDDGTGLQPGRPNGQGMGLRIMSSRAHVIGARFDISRHERAGTIVSCLLLPREPAASRARRVERAKLHDSTGSS